MQELGLHSNPITLQYAWSCSLDAMPAPARIMLQHAWLQVGSALVPYVLLLVVPLLRCMSDASGGVRAAASVCFGELVALLPLAQVCKRTTL